MPTSSSSDTVVPCMYRTGRTIGSGTYAVVKEAIHIVSGERFACKVINKKLMEGREHLVRNEVDVLKRISSGHKNIVALRDYFETAWNLYLCFDLCTGGELFDRICAKGNYYEADAANIVRSITDALKHIHAEGIVHRDLKPENLIFRTEAEDADVMIADFGLSRVISMDDGTLDSGADVLTEVCGTPAYMAPEVFNKAGHGQPVDIWALGVITYFLLAGYTPFDRRTPKEEIRAIKKGDYTFAPQKYWSHVSESGKDFIRRCLMLDPRERPTAEVLLEHEWLNLSSHEDTQPQARTNDLLPFFKQRPGVIDSTRSISWSPPSSPDSSVERQEALRKCQKESHQESDDMGNLDVLRVEGRGSEPDVLLSKLGI